MAVLNRTPDSFSDGGQFLSDRKALVFAEKALAAGATILDVGGESTRPGASSISIQEEIRRTASIVRKIRRKFSAILSIDTRKPDVAEAALEEGAAIINDVSGLRSNPRLAHLAARYDAGLVIVHSRGTPQTMATLTHYEDLIGEIQSELDHAMAVAEEEGLSREKLILDPGIGFAKTADQSYSLMKHLRELHRLGRPLLVGPSRKSFLGDRLNLTPRERLPGTLASVALAVASGAHIVRVHDVESCLHACRIADAIVNAA